MLATQEIQSRVARVLVETLCASEEEMTLESTLQEDLGAESIDFLDIVFRLEREFGIRIPNDELFPNSIFGGDPTWVNDGRVTEDGLSELRSRMPFADLSGFDRDRRVTAVRGLFTVGLLNRYIAWKLEQEAQQPTAVTSR
jgi:acyl carrier protein